MLILVFSCSKDDERPLTEDVNNASWDITVTNVSATSVFYETSNTISNFDIVIGYRRVGDEKVYELGMEEVKGSELLMEGGLEPLTNYEFMAYNKKTQDVSNRKVTFSTMPFDIFYNEHNTNYSDEFIASHEGFEHAIKLGNVSSKAVMITAKLFPEEPAGASVELENVRVENDSLYFSIPKNIIPDDPYETYRTYSMEYTIGDRSFELDIPDQNNINDYKIKKNILVVYNTKPQILSATITKFEAVDYACGNIPSYNIALSGAFMNVYQKGPFLDEDDGVGYGFIEKNKVRVFVTNKETGDFFFVEPLTDIQKCSFFIRVGDKPYENPFGLNVYHRMDGIGIRGLESEYEFHPGEYSIRVVFEKGDEFYETNEYSFTITE